MQCKTCIQLENALISAKSTDEPEILSGLTESGLRNRALQKEERLRKAELELEKHRRTCSDVAAKASA